MQKYYSLRRLWGVIISCMVVIMIGDYNKAFGCLEDEKIALLKIQDAINHDHTIIQWGTAGKEVEDCCRWEGVTCDPFSKRIISLYLNPSGMDPNVSLDASLFQPFEELQNFNFSSDGMTCIKGPLRLPKLQVLDLSFCGLISIPPMGELPSLKFFYLTDSLVYDNFEELTNSSSLELLNLEFNGLEGRIPPSILALTSLKMLGLSLNYLNGSLPEGLCALTNLEELDLSGNLFEGVIPTCLSNLTSLWLLDLSNNNFSGSIPPNIFPRLKSLEYLSLSHNHFDGLFSFSSFADHSKLEVFKLESDNPNLKVETENTQGKPPLFQLKILHLSNCILNEPTGAIPSFLLSQYDLRFVDLSSSGMSGELPSWLLTNNSRLESLILRDNSFTGQFVVKSDAYNAYMTKIDISMNQVAGEIPTFIGSIFPNLTYLNMSTNTIEGSIPSSIGNMTQLELLDISNNHLSGEFVGDLFNGCSKELSFLMLSNNNLGGNLTNLLPNVLQHRSLAVLYLDNNKFSGELRLENLRLARGCPITYLDISNNSITGRFPDWIAQLPYLETLVLSKNHFHGKLPISFCKLNVQILDLSWNNFSDTLPPCTNLSNLIILHLEGNGFHGPLPTFLSRSYTISTLDVSHNKFSGLIPAWIGSLSNLAVIVLKGNIFHGSIPSELCQMKYLRILDFSANNLSGYVPPCFSRIHFDKRMNLPIVGGIGGIVEQELVPMSFGYSNKNLLRQDLSDSDSDGGGYRASNVPDEVQFITKTLSESYTGNILYSMTAIDLSRNRLTGPIPIHIGIWENIHSLNLSYNHFNGSIPIALSSLINLESLDLSHNMLSGKIPSEITEMNFLSWFSVAYNNLSGPIPTTTSGQFVTFDARCYEGNSLLCGPLLNTSCSGGPTKMQQTKLFAEPEQNDSSYKTTFLWSFFGSFIVSCIGAFVFIYFGTNIPQKFLVWIRVEEKVSYRRTVELPLKWNK